MRPVAALLLAALAGGCTQIDPYTRTGSWQPEGVNDRNLAAMVATPSDLLQGRGDRGPGAVRAVSAVNNLNAGRAKPLPSLSADATPGSGTPAAAGGGSAPATGGSDAAR